MPYFPENIIISRTDSIGDVILTLPIAGLLKRHFPTIKIAFLGKAYTRAVIEACQHIDQFIEVNDFLNADNIMIDGKAPNAILHVFPVSAIAKKARQLKIPLRIGTTNRLYHWFTCNKLVALSRKNSNLHEAQLNLKLLKGLGLETEYSLEQIQEMFGLKNLKPLPQKFQTLIHSGKYNLILHPKSQGSAREWGIPNFVQLIQLLDKDRYQLFVSGTEKEGILLAPLFDAVGDAVINITGQMNLDEFISFIAACDGLVANSTGPLHIAAALGKHAMGIYPPMRPIHPGRWAPLGKNAKVFVLNKNCTDCKEPGSPCACIMDITPISIRAAIDQRN